MALLIDGDSMFDEREEMLCVDLNLTLTLATRSSDRYDTGYGAAKRHHPRFTCADAERRIVEEQTRRPAQDCSHLFPCIQMLWRYTTCIRALRQAMLRPQYRAWHPPCPEIREHPEIQKDPVCIRRRDHESSSVSVQGHEVPWVQIEETSAVAAGLWDMSD